MGTANELEGLRALARGHGVQTEYVDMTGAVRPAAPETLLGVLRALGRPIERPTDAADALRERRHELATRRLAPVVVAWDGRAEPVEIRLPEAVASRPLECLLTLESGEARRWEVGAGGLGAVEGSTSEGTRLVSGRLSLGGEALPAGYHRLTVRDASGRVDEVLVISAPTRAYQGPEGDRERTWGVFCPLYALHRASTRGAGDFADLEALMDWTAGLGGGLVATLPMLATAIDERAESISPYSPASRLFWNEFYLDLHRIPELAESLEARRLLESAEFADELDAIGRGPLVHYGRQMRLKRRVLGAMADAFFAGEGSTRSEYAGFVAARPDVEDYATFMAAVERFGHDRSRWPDGLRDPSGAGSVDPAARRYHLFAQWQADRQLREMSAAARDRGLTWYVDFPIGVDAGSYDVWKHPDLFALGASVGCPPDPTFTKGQDWGFPPLHPERERAGHVRYLVAAFRHHLRSAGALRLDHVMGLHRLYWIPRGLDGSMGAFVTYPAEQAYAVLCLESHRNRAWLVGENLGTVPPEVDTSLERHGIRGMYAIQYEQRADADPPLLDVPGPVVASVNTHDMPPFAAQWAGLDIGERVDLGLLAPDAADDHYVERAQLREALVGHFRDLGLIGPDEGEDDPAAVLRACWEYLAASPARVVLLNLEDLWLETEPQNTPNTVGERPNWRRKLRRSLDDFAADPAVLDAIRRVAEARKRSAAGAEAPAKASEATAPAQPWSRSQ